MRAGNLLCRRLSQGVLAVGVLACTVSAFGQDFTLRPTASATVSGRPATSCPGAVYLPGTNELTITGGGCTVYFDIRGSGWGSAPGSPQLGAYQATIDSTGATSGDGYLGANATPANAGCDLDPVGNILNVPNEPTRNQGCYQVIQVCSGNARDCTTGQPGCVGPEGFCVGNADFILDGTNPVAAVAFITLDYEYGGAAQSGGKTDPAPGTLHGGALIVDVPSCAAGSYVVDFLQDSTKTFMNDPQANLIPGLTTTPGTITVITGSCCYNIGPGTTQCQQGVTNSQCNALAAPRAFRVGQDCPPIGPSNSGPESGNGPECPNCQVDGDCDDNNDCTADTCNSATGVCTNALTYNPALNCCNPNGAALTLIDDNNPCTADVCNADGSVDHNPTTGNACDDGFDCTVDDTCQGDLGVGTAGCQGTDVNTIACATDADCPLGTCGTAVPGFCECSESTSLCANFLTKVCSVSGEPCQADSDCGSVGGVCVRGNFTDPNCYEEGEDVAVSLHIGAGSQCVSGGQFLIQYDPTCLDFVSIGPCGGELIFTEVIESTADEAAGEIFYAVISDPGTVANECDPGPYDIACLHFTKLAGCDGCEICLGNENPRNTILTNDQGNRVPLDSCGCSKSVRTNGDLVLNTPPGEMTNADCARTYAVVNWATPSANDSCDGPLAVTCAAQHVGGLNIGGLINNGGNIPQGKSFFVCSATNSCGETKTNVWTVMVSDQHSLDVEVHLQPEINNDGPFSRAITFELYDDCSGAPVEECAVIDFQGPWNFAGHGTASLKIDKNNYQCITARDCLHTLRACADIECVGDRYAALFKGDPLQGGNWLIGGNLDGCKSDSTFGDKNTINILDFGVFMAELAAGSSYEPNGDTDCNTPHPHGDINADGVVDNADYAFILANFLVHSKDCCCPAPPGNALSNPITSISVKELRRAGYASAAVADLNKDGTLNLDDMAAYMQGVMPAQNNVRPTKGGRGTR